MRMEMENAAIFWLSMLSQKHHEAVVNTHFGQKKSRVNPSVKIK